MAGRRMVRESKRAFRANFAECSRLDLARNPFMAKRRKAAQRLRSRMPSMRRAFQALNVMGLRIWADKPRLFGGRELRAGCATVARSVARAEEREWRAVAERWAHALGVLV